MATTPQPPPHSPDHPPPPPAPSTEQDKEKLNKEREAEAKKVFDAYEKDDEDGLPLTTQTDQLKRSADMEKVGVANWMAEQERRIRDRQGEPPNEPRQVHGVAPAQKPR